MGKKREILRGLIIASGAIILHAAAAFGQHYDTTKVAILNEVVITATRGEKNLNNIGRSITVITRDDIINTGASTISELLNREEGFYITGAQQIPGSLSNISTRGTNNSHTIIMIDGIRISDPSSTDNSLDLSELSLTDIERIEIVRGSHSTLYGSSAIGGAINIITSRDYNTPGVHADANLKAGIFGKGGSIFSENLMLNYTHKSGFYLTGEIFNIKSGGINSTIDTIQDPLVYKHPDMSDGFRKTDLVAKGGYKSDRFDIYGSFKKADQIIDIDDGAFRDDENYTVGFTRNLLTYGADYRLNNKLSFTLTGGISSNMREATDDSSRIDVAGNTDRSYFSGTYSGTLSNNEIQANFYTRGLQMVIGSGFQKETMSAETYYFSDAWGVYILKTDLDSLRINTTTSTGFLHTDINGSLIDESLKPVSLGLGARITEHSSFGTFFTYEINPSIRIRGNALLYFSFSTGFNAPSLYQLYSPERDFMSGITRGNKNLRPEESSSWEIGIKQKVNNNLWWSISYFNTTVSNLIEYVYLWNKDQEINSLSYSDYFGDTYLNLGKQKNKGVEFRIHSKLSDKLSLMGNVSLVNGKFDYDPENIDKDQTHENHIQLYSSGAFISRKTERIGLTRRPNTANLNLTYLPFEDFQLMLDLKYVGARNDVFYDSSLGPYGALGSVGLEDYTLLSCRAKYTILKGFSTVLQIENIFNVKYCDIMGYSTRGRGLYGSIRYTF